MADLEKQVKDLFEKGLTLAQLRRIAFPHLYDGPTGLRLEERTRQRSESTKIILSILGYKNEAEYARGCFNKREENEACAKEEASNWNDEEKAKQIIELFESGMKLREIRDSVFLKWSADMPKHDIYYRKSTIDHIILRVLDCEDWDDYTRKQRNQRARRKYQKLKQEGKTVDSPSIIATLERDGNKCVISGATDAIVVHHIDGDRSNNDLTNLISLSKEVHKAIHNGARAYVGKDLKYWEQTKPEYVSDLKKRLEYMEEYVEHLRMRGYEQACVESISGEILFGSQKLCKELNISPVRKRSRGWYRVVVLKPTGYYENPIEYEKQQSEFDKFIEEMEELDNDEHEGVFYHE